MKIIEPIVQNLERKEYKLIEYAGRICYRTEDNMTEESFKTFCTARMKTNHYSIFEHEVVTMLVPYDISLMHNILFNIDEHCSKFFYLSPFSHGSNATIVTGNIRSWIQLFDIYQSDGYKLLFEQLYNTLATKYNIIFNKPTTNKTFSILTPEYIMKTCDYDVIRKHCYETFFIQTSRITTQQITRHRISSFSQASQRYCNYSNDKFGSEVSFVYPYLIRQQIKNGTINPEVLNEYNQTYIDSENHYFKLLELGMIPEDARDALCNGVASQIVMTCSLDQWDRVFALRVESHAQADVRDLMTQVKSFIDTKYKE